MNKISSDTVRADFNDMTTVVHYARAAHFLGLWKSEQLLIERFFTDKNARLLEAGCGAGRVTIGLWDLGFRNLDAFDFAEELLDQARSLINERAASTSIRLFHADATRLRSDPGYLSLPPRNPASPSPNNPLCHVLRDKVDCEQQQVQTVEKSGKSKVSATPKDVPISAQRPKAEAPESSCASLRPSSVSEDRQPSAESRKPTAAVCYEGALFMFNGLMQIPGRENRRKAMRELAAVCVSGAPFLFTTHDRNASRTEQALWRLETIRWERGEQDPRLVEFGDRYFEHETGRTFMHLPDREEILQDLAATGWQPEYDELRRKISKESRAVQDFSDECRFWLARKG